MKKNNELGKGIATAGIWLGVAYTAPYLIFFTVFVAGAALLATWCIWSD